jgi:hypothetical protein
MSTLAIQAPQRLPAPAFPISIRPATLGDVPFIDRLQKQQSRQVGFFPTRAIEGKIDLGHVLIATAGGSQSSGSDGRNDAHGVAGATALQVGYLIGNDQYYKRDDLGCIFQMNVLPTYRRSLVAANLLKAQFERSAYGCKLYCCWCAQDIEANKFWEAMGFVAIAYRTGSEKKGKNGSPRVHIFWQKRIRQGDVTTPWWFPSKTSGGAIGSDRIVLPIPPGLTWRDELPVLLASDSGSADGRVLSAVSGSLRTPHDALSTSSPTSPRGSVGLRKKPKTDEAAARKLGPCRIAMSRMSFAAPAAPVETVEPTRPKRAKVKADPELIAKARELRDKYLEQANEAVGMIASAGKYEVSRQVEKPSETKRLAA